MFLMTMFIFLETSIQPSSESGDYSSPGKLYVNGSDAKNGSYNNPQATSKTLNIWSINGVLIILGIALAAGMVAGITVLGSGVSGFAESLIFSSILYLGLWGCLTIISSSFFFNNGPLVMIIWVGLTMLYVVGFATQINSSEGT